jgi:mRNA-degrading endonuclease RelE of RelBE toxin-antitoxin system
MPAKASEITEEVTIQYASHEFDPIEIADFIRMPSFNTAWNRLKLTALDMRVLQTMIAMAPVGPPVIKGTGGVRKIRFADPKSNRGKSGGYRVCYAYFEECRIVLLMQIYPKNRKDNLTKFECNQIRRQLGIFETSLQNKPLC